MTKADVRRQHGVANVLLASLLLMLAPLLIAHVLGSTDTLNVGIPLAFLLVVGLLAHSHLRWRHRLLPTALLVAILLSLAQALPLWWGGLVGDDLMLGDVMNVLARPLTFLLFVGLFLQKKLPEREVVVFFERFTLVVVGVAVYGFVVGLSSVAGIGLGVSSYSVDYSSFLANRNQFGMLLFLGLASLLLARAVRGAMKRDILVGVVLFASVALTMSRGSLLGVAILLFLVWAARRPFSLAFMLVPALVIATFVVSLYPLVGRYIGHFLIRREVGLSGREEIWDIGRGLVAERPVQGWGSFLGLAVAELRGMSAGQLHSFWLEQLVSWGLIGFMLLMSIFIVVWHLAYQSSPPRVRHVLLGAGAGSIAMGSFESISVLSVGYTDIVWTIAVLTVPVLLSRVDWVRAGPTSAAVAPQSGVVSKQHLGPESAKG